MWLCCTIVIGTHKRICKRWTVRIVLVRMKQVYVFRFITEGSVEERMLKRAAKELWLNQLVLHACLSSPFKLV